MAESHMLTVRREGVALTTLVLLLLLPLPPAGAGAPDMDYGDAPDSYGTTLASDGARHPNAGGLALGDILDAEPDGQSSADATGDDVLGADDEDGVAFPTLNRGQQASVGFKVSNAGTLRVWVDFNQDGDFTDVADLALSATVTSAYDGTINVAIPATALEGTTFARVRLTTVADIGPTGAAPDGEVEDYQVLVSSEHDFGDAPASYATLLADDGARHIPTGAGLGANRDIEADGQPNNAAIGDDLAGGPDDEDGIAGPTFVSAGQDAVFTALPSGPGKLDAWIDFNNDGDFLDPGEQVATSFAVTSPSTTLSVAIPDSAAPGGTYSRFRLSTAGGLGPAGPADNGEVEDHTVVVRDQDYGDAPDSYGTTRAADGARHNSPAEIFLGVGVDHEAEGQPTGDATGDDIAVTDDEDGATLPTLDAGEVESIGLAGNGSGLGNVWIDYNRNGTFTDAGEHVIVEHNLVAAFNETIPISVPTTVADGLTFARVRVSRAAGIGPTGLAPDGEVEDYQVLLVNANTPVVGGPGGGSPSPATFDSNRNAVLSPTDEGVRIVLTNPGDAAAQPSPLIIELSGPAEVVLPDGCTLEGNTITCTLGELAAGDSATIVLSVAPAGVAVLTAQVGDSEVRVQPVITDDLIEFAIDVSAQRFVAVDAPAFAQSAPTADWVVLSRNDVFADSLTGTSLTGKAPLLLTGSDALDDRTAAEVARVLGRGGTVYLLGGEIALAAVIADDLAAAGYNVVRLAGPTRIETAVDIADAVVAVNGEPDVVAVARADGPPDNPTAAWADAVAAGGWAADTGQPILLSATDGGSPPTAAWLAEHPADVVGLGGTAALSSAAAEDLGVDRRVEGANRFDTAADAVDRLWTSPATGRIVAPGSSPTGWAYALVAAGLAADSDRPLLLTELDRLPIETDLATCAGDDRLPVLLLTPSSVTTEAVSRGLRAPCDQASEGS